MSWFSSTEKNASTPTPPTTEGGSRYGVGAEQDRYASHFGVGEAGMDRAKEGLKSFVNQKGEGAEQDRYNSHFGLREDPVLAAATWLAKQQNGSSGAEQDRWGGHFGLGADGWARAKKMAETPGTGAEQVRLI